MNAHLEPKRVISYLFILAIAVVFTLQFGPGSRGCEQPLRPQKTAAAAVVNGKEISARDFITAYNNQLQMFRARGTNLPSSVLRQLGIPQQVLEQLVTAELLAQAAEKQGIEPSNEEIVELLSRNPDFEVDGAFNFQRYQQVLREYYRKSESEYEGELRRRLAAQKLFELVASEAVVSEDEVKARYFREANKAAATFVRFLPTMYASAVPSPKSQELAAYRKDHGKEIADYYQANQFLYRTPERVHARHILIKVDKDAPAEPKQAARERLVKVRQQIEQGKDFAAAATEYSEDEGSKSSGGDLGFNERANWVPEFAKAAFALQPGEVSQPVETEFGFHLIKVEERKPPENKELKDVEEEIARQLYTKEKAKQLAKGAADKALAGAQKSGKPLAELYPADKGKPAGKSRFETESKPTSTETGSFTASGDSVPQLGPSAELAKDIAAASGPGLLPKVYSAGDGFAVVQLTERKRPTDPEFAASKEKSREEALRAKQGELRESYLQALKKAATIQENQEMIAQLVNAS